LQARALEDGPERTNPLSAAAWILAGLSLHWHPAVAAQARKCARAVAPTPGDNAVQAHRDLSRAYLFHPAWPIPPPNPLHGALKRMSGLPPRQRRPVFPRCLPASGLAAGGDETDDEEEGSSGGGGPACFQGLFLDAHHFQAKALGAARRRALDVARSAYEARKARSELRAEHTKPRFPGGTKKRVAQGAPGGATNGSTKGVSKKRKQGAE